MKKKLITALCIAAAMGMTSSALAGPVDINDITAEFNFQPSNDVTMLYWAGNADNFETATGSGTTVQQYLLACKHSAGDQYYFTNQSSNILGSTRLDALKGTNMTDALDVSGVDFTPADTDLPLNTSKLNEAHPFLSAL